MSLMPFMIDLSSQKIVVAGGGRVAERRIRSLLESGASITVISPSVTEGIRQYANRGKIVWKQAKVQPTDLNEAFLVIAATDDEAVNQSVIASAPSSALVNASSDFEKGNTQFPAVVKRGKLSIAISTNGASPKLAMEIKNKIEEEFDEKYKYYLEFLNKVRQIVKKSDLKKSEQRLLLQDILQISYEDERKQRLVIEKLRRLTEKGGVR